MAPGGNVIELGKALRAESDAIRADLPAGAEMHEAARPIGVRTQA